MLARVFRLAMLLMLVLGGAGTLSFLMFSFSLSALLSDTFTLLLSDTFTLAGSVDHMLVRSVSLGEVAGVWRLESWGKGVRSCGNVIITLRRIGC